MKKISLYIIAALFGLLFLNSCIDDDFAEPIIVESIFTLPEGAIVKTIPELKKIYTDANPRAKNPIMNADLFKVIEEDFYVSGYVVSNDEFGNFYKNIVIQGELDGSSEGINISIGESDLNSKFAVGQKVWVKCQGLTLGLYGNNVQIGGGNYWYKFKEFRLSPILSPAISSHIFRDGSIQTIPTKIKTIDQLTADDRFTLITLNDIQFKGGDAGTTWANVLNDHSPVFPFKSTIIEDANGNELTVFTSDFSDFGSKLTPTGSGTIIGVLSAHNGEPQLVVNSISIADVDMTGNRFGTSGGDNGGDYSGTLIKVDNFNADFTGQVVEKSITSEGWHNIKEKGSRDWIAKVFNNDTYAQSTGYKATDDEIVSWLISPAVSVSTQKVFSVSTSKAYWAHADTKHPLEIVYADDFDGSNYKTATWQTLDVTVAQKSDGDNAWISSGNVNLPVIDGKHISIAFKYIGSKTETTTYRLDKIKVSE
ncbi:hypothetical protein DWB61_00825 [Ancylomarina euxinus]|uniref:DUF5689 domain-containing protein n=1 Tax=Ancylomarina euxinus TaxID=2283627 RepID=A0A425Y7U7_9BACT|nr:DUF5689 domain-containing protein [Ancylomarina euxinus]MCZ4693544.1 DUF5689 domain-containing protein [Ancylomarina euxinus]MUP13771.1 hypothetical protein [Ancylomarina euxinus]RRG24591.1 hypothetical protein DWB61_00825 [Ancylomarina euxinus]